MAILKNITLIFVLCHGLLMGQSSMTPPGLSLKQYISNIEENYPLVQRADNLIHQAKLNLKAQRGQYDPFIKADYNNKYFDGNNYYSVLNSEIKQPLFTSQYLKAGYEFGDGIYLNPESKTSSYGLPFVGFEAALLQGMFFDKRRAGVLKAREYIDYGKAERNEIVNDVLFNAINAYSELSFVNKQLTIYRYFIQLAQIRNNGISALAQIGEKPFIDTVEASIIYQSRVLELQALEIENRKKKASVNSFNWFQNGNTDLQFDFTPDSLDQLFEVYKNIMVRELNIDSINNPIIQQYKIKQNILKIDKRLKAEMIKPQLDVKYNFLTNDNGAFNPQLTSNNYRWGATLSFPLFLRTPRNEYKIAGLDVLNAKLETETKSNELNNKINFTVKALTVITEQINNAAKNVALSKRLLEAEKLKFDNGESSLFLLNMRENKWLETELKLAEYKLKFIETVLQLVHLKGNLNYKA